MEKKTHYRKVFKSDHLGVADLEDFKEEGRFPNLMFTIARVKQESGVLVAGRKGNFNIAYFRENIKPLVLNATNSKVLKNLSGGSSFVEDWSNILVQLYIDPTAKLKGEIVGGVRINTNTPKQSKTVITKATINAWNSAKAAYVRDGNFDAVLKRADISIENQEMIMEECKNSGGIENV